MTNCFSSPDENKDDQEFKPAKARGCTDVLWLVVYIVFWLFMVSNTYIFKMIHTQNRKEIRHSSKASAFFCYI